MTPPPKQRSRQEIQTENAVALDYILNDILTKGLVVEDPETHELIRAHPSAAHLRVALDRQKQLGIGPVLTGEPKADAVAEEIRRRVLKLGDNEYGFPDVDTDGEDFATRTSG